MDNDMEKDDTSLMVPINTKKIAEYLENSQMSLADFARESGISRGHIYQLFNSGRVRRATAGKLKKLIPDIIVGEEGSDEMDRQDRVTGQAQLVEREDKKVDDALNKLSLTFPPADPELIELLGFLQEQPHYLKVFMDWIRNVKRLDEDEK